jgi:crotonobetainyl-CoA:carnitine CoA-transferase CaiB-like acyl-CoA transferase
MGQPDWTADARYQDLHAMGRDYPEEVDALITPWLKQHTRAELMHLAQQHGFPLGPLRTMAEVVASPQFAHRGFFRHIPHAKHGAITVPGVPWLRADRQTRVPPAAPRLGQHTSELMRELGSAAQTVAA